jgi:Ca2+-binding RTX toxin-like protein
MKKLILIVLTFWAALLAPPVYAEPGPLTLLLSGSSRNDSFRISLNPDGRQYLIFSTSPLEAGGDLCSHPEERGNELSCLAPAISGFEVNALGGSDLITFTSDIPVPVTVRGGAGGDHVRGGGASDKLVGGSEHDVLFGRRGDDWILGGPGPDGLIGGQGNDQLRGGPGADDLIGGPGDNFLLQ